MRNAPPEPVSRGSWRRWRRLLAGGYLLIVPFALYGFIEWKSASFLLGILILLYTPAFDNHPAGNFRFGWPALGFAALFLLIPVKTILYATVVCAVCCYRECFFRRVENTTGFVLALITPIAGYFSDSFSFPIRLRLTALAGRLIGRAGLPVSVAGNAITFHDRLFTVDPVCMGLHMLIFSLLTGLLLINYYQRHFTRRLSTGLILLLLLLTAFLNVIANLLRIICLVVLDIPPENPLHGLMGLLTILLYVFLPLLVVIRRVIRRFGRPTSAVASPPAVSRDRRFLAGNILVALTMAILTGFSQLSQKTAPPLTPGQHIPGYTIRSLKNGILQLDNDRSLVYIKPIPGWYCTDHTPSICWKGSGYTFASLQQSRIGGITVVEGKLEKAHETLYTAWWYDNGLRQTTGPLDWRLDLLHGSPGYSVVNVTAATPEALREEIARIRQALPFRSLLGRPGR